MATGAHFTINQAANTVPSGTLDTARIDLRQGQLIHFVGDSSGSQATPAWTVLAWPSGSARGTPTNAASFDASYTPDVPGSYLMQYLVNDGLAANAKRFVFCVTQDANGLIIDDAIREPAYGERVGDDNVGGNDRGFAKAYEVGMAAAAPAISNAAALISRKAAKHKQVNLLGYYTPGDGGGGLIRWDGASTATHDGGMTFQPGYGTAAVLATGRWVRDIQGHIPAVCFGASKDASAATNTAAIQAALDIAGPRGVDVVLPSGGVSYINPFILKGAGAGIAGASTGGTTLLPTVRAVNVIGATNASPIVVQTDADPGLQTGMFAFIRGVLGNTAANGNWKVTRVDATHFSLAGTVGNGAYSSGGTVAVPAVASLAMAYHCRVKRLAITCAAGTTFTVGLDASNMNAADIDAPNITLHDGPGICIALAESPTGDGPYYNHITNPILSGSSNNTHDTTAIHLAYAGYGTGANANTVTGGNTSSCMRSIWLDSAIENCVTGHSTQNIYDVSFDFGKQGTNHGAIGNLVTGGFHEGTSASYLARYSGWATNNSVIVGQVSTKAAGLGRDGLVDPVSAPASGYGGTNVTSKSFHVSSAIVDIMQYLPLSSDIGQAIGSAIRTLPSTGGTIDLRGLSGAQTIATTIVVDRPIEFIPSKSATITATCNPAVDVTDANFRMHGNDRAAKWISASNGSLFRLRGRRITSATNAAECVVTTDTAHFYATGQYVVCSNLISPNPITVATVTVLSATTFKLNGVAGPASYVSGTSYVSKSNSDCQFEVYGVSLYGNGASSRCLDTTLLAPGQFSEGHIGIVNNYVANFGIACELNTSVYYGQFSWNAFFTNGIGVIIGNSANAQVDHNRFHQGAHEQIRDNCFGTKIFANEFLGNSAYVGEPDIVLYPDYDGGSDGAYSYITGNNFFGEGESLDPRRARVEVRYPTHTEYSSAACNIEGNTFIGFGQWTITSASVSAGTVTASVSPQSHGIVNGQTAWVNILNCTNGTYNGKFLVTSTGSSTFTYASTRASGAYGAATGLVTAASVPGSSLSPCAIRYTNPGARHLVDNNTFNNYATIIDDIQTKTPAVTTSGAGCNVFGRGNRIAPPFTGSAQVFTNGGIGWEFTDLQGSQGMVGVAAPASAKREGCKLQNNLTYSEDFTNAAWVKSATVTVTATQTGPDGKTRAALISADGTAGAQDMSQVFTPTATTQWVQFWAKAGPTTDGQVGDTVLCGIFDVNVSAFVCSGERMRLRSTWTKYCFPVQGIDLAHFNRLSFRLAGNNQAKGAFYIAFPQISDEPTDYVPTTSAIVNDANSSVRFDQPIVISQLRAQQRGSLPVASVAGLSTGLGTGGSPQTLITGNAVCGVVTIQMGSTGVGTAGNITVSFGVPFTGAIAPVIVLGLAGSNNNWPPGSNVLAWNVSNSSFDIAWSTPVATAGNAYAISYMVIGS